MKMIRKSVEKGMFLNKLNIKRQKFEEVFYKLDLVNHQLIASKKSIRKNKYLVYFDKLFNVRNLTFY